MILRKPYAFLIKKFKIIHAILLVMALYILYKTGVLFNFFNNYLLLNNNVIGNELVAGVYNPVVFVFPYLIIVVSLILLGVLFIKKKPFFFYIYNIVTNIFLLVVLNLSYSAISNMEISLVSVRAIRLLRDLLSMGFILQIISIMYIIVRTTGFDIKKFNFGKDMKDLNIDETDNEEFEVSVAFDTNVILRDIKRRLRNFKYVYVENRFLINIFVGIGLTVILFTVYMNGSLHNKVFKENTYFSASNFNMKVNNVYTTSNDYRNVPIDDVKALVLVELSVKTINKNGKAFSATDGVININNHNFYPISSYRDKLIDLGNTYMGEPITKEYKKILLVYEVPKQYLTKEIQFRYATDYLTVGHKLVSKYIGVDLQPINLDGNVVYSKSLLKEPINFNDSILKKTILIINEVALNEKFKLNYTFCKAPKECTTSHEYLMASVNGNMDKALIKIVGNVIIDKEVGAIDIKNLYDVINKFGTLYYEIDGVKKTNNVPLKLVKSLKVNEKDTYYMEVDKEILKASKVSLVFNVRNYQFEYELK